jgi:hypothetical protein
MIQVSVRMRFRTGSGTQEIDGLTGVGNRQVGVQNCIQNCIPRHRQSHSRRLPRRAPDRAWLRMRNPRSRVRCTSRLFVPQPADVGLSQLALGLGSGRGRQDAGNCQDRAKAWTKSQDSRVSEISPSARAVFRCSCRDRAGRMLRKLRTSLARSCAARIPCRRRTPRVRNLNVAKRGSCFPTFSPVAAPANRPPAPPASTGSVR